MFFYSPLLTWIVVGSFPFYIAISAGVTPLFRQRLDEKFERGAENQAFLVESVTGIETLKAMAVEPQMQRRWEEQLAGYVRASFRVHHARQSREPGGPARQQAGHGRHPLFRRAARDRRQSHASANSSPSTCWPAGSAQPVLRLAQMWQDFHQARLSVARLGDILNTRAEPTYQPGRAHAAGDPRRHRLRACHLPLSHRRAGSAAGRLVSRCRPARLSASSAPRARASSTLAKLVQRLYVPESGRVLVDGIDLAMVDRRLAAPPDRRRAAGERAVQPLGPRQHRARRSGDADGARDRGGAARRRA